MMEVFTHLDNSITLKPVTDPAFEYGQTQFEKANATLSDEVMKNIGVQDSTVIKSLGIFAIVFFLLLVLLGIYFLMKMCEQILI